MSYVSYSGVVKRTTDSAILVTPKSTKGIEYLHGDQWFPRKVVLDGDTLEDGDTDIEVKLWFIRKHGIELP